ncbi:Histone chaperone asf1 [Entophlyctis luteolus]|nr:Histone chaperone asf1 [Entophlyctis luteolus]KAJ3353288.1 Histone chaperone asf1 [Entophlyctis luteolus]KAJ3388256.1 Histone chaperone asf1 [Entophlyctis sp. JEL0112]
MALVNLTNVAILNNPSTFFNPFTFEITFEVISELQEDLEFKLIYVGSAESEAFDQVLEEIMVGPVPVGVNKFVFEAPHPDPALLPASDVLGVTVVLLKVSYREREFIRVGYYVNMDYADEALRESPPPAVAFDKLERSILADRPRVTRFNIPWDSTEEEMEEDQEGQDDQEQNESSTGGLLNLPFKPAFNEIDPSALLTAGAAMAMGSSLAGFGSIARAAAEEQKMDF